ncbi:MAG: hypothetical protein GDA56_14535 [Hormoscilla sp. GM7CHS1pb]|nr:hypothetical protein [Hormoscilla sp. GM7CHS1pb]
MTDNYDQPGYKVTDVGGNRIAKSTGGKRHSIKLSKIVAIRLYALGSKGNEGENISEEVRNDR